MWTHLKWKWNSISAVTDKNSRVLKMCLISYMVIGIKMSRVHVARVGNDSTIYKIIHVRVNQLISCLWSLLNVVLISSKWSPSLWANLSGDHVTYQGPLVRKCSACDIKILPSFFQVETLSGWNVVSSFLWEEQSRILGLIRGNLQMFVNTACGCWNQGGLALQTLWCWIFIRPFTGNQHHQAHSLKMFAMQPRPCQWDASVSRLNLCTSRF